MSRLLDRIRTAPVSTRRVAGVLALLLITGVSTVQAEGRSDDVANAAPPVGASAAAAAAAHQIGQAYLYLRVFQDSLIVRIEIERRDIARALDLDWDLDQPYDQALVDRDLQLIRDYIEDKFYIATEPSGRLDFDFRSVDSRILRNFADFILLEYELDGGWELPPELEAGFTALFEIDSDHRNLLVVEHNWRTGTFNNEATHSLIFSPRSPSGTLDLNSSGIWQGFLGFIWFGIWHILIGTDHILFLVALILPSVLRREDGKWVPVERFSSALWNIVKIVTFFTIAHSVTLSMAALGWVSVPSRFIETVIAASIAVAAWANLRPDLKIQEWKIAFVFGLFHGFGFASVMADLGLEGEHLVASLLGFNIGVELGQVAIICVVFPILFALRKTRVYLPLLTWGSILLIALALLWAAERLFNFDIPLRRMARRLVGVGV